ncbi:unnamed protein product [Microthlaspi erraticum]|uniref:Reverse transcriptase domain-containing protein n=1 Tax=Microthlaspi erraticum TaxID=1685480 RepID=A0A6D2IIN4_9BRAS|nr:unnamed protein product [Microthlaspi erraticum]
MPQVPNAERYRHDPRKSGDVENMLRCRAQATSFIPNLRHRRSFSDRRIQPPAPERAPSRVGQPGEHRRPGSRTLCWDRHGNLDRPRAKRRPDVQTDKQKRRKLGHDRAQAVNDEVERLSKAGSIVEVRYPGWLANPVVVKKKNGKWRVCVDFTDLNKACPKDSYPLPAYRSARRGNGRERATILHGCFLRLQPDPDAPDDREKTAFITDRGTYCYKVMRSA